MLTTRLRINSTDYMKRTEKHKHNTHHTKHKALTTIPTTAAPAPTIIVIIASGRLLIVQITPSATPTSAATHRQVERGALL